MTITEYGERALRVELGSLTEVHGFAHALRRRAVAGVVDVVPGWTTVVVTLDESADVSAIRAQLDGLKPTDISEVGRTHVFHVRYDGPDLVRVAEHAGLTADQVVRRHCDAVYTVAFLGFVPGFAYLSGLDAALVTPRLATPRQAVPAGSVGIADNVTAVYPASTPGGWNLIGRTAVTLFDVTEDPPARLAPGDRVRFAPG